VRVPLIANGEIWTVEDWDRCRQISGCTDVMLGRGAVADPFLAARLRGEPAGTWFELERPLQAFWAGVQAKVEARHAPGRLKQWLMLLSRTWPEAEALFQRVRPLRHPREITPLLAAAFDPARRAA
jgi:tRNA-dihydrouridine synthase C